MIALVVLALSLAVGPPPDGPAAARPASGDAAVSAWAADGPCCAGDAGARDREPCGPGDSCPPFSGCCACASCGKRVADAPARASLDEPDDLPADRAPSGAPSGIDGVGAVWHPPRG